jgi:hypothetical protein
MRAGNMAHPPNALAVKAILNDILPRMRRVSQRLDIAFTLQIIGSSLNPALREWYKDVHFLPNLDQEQVGSKSASNKAHQIIIIIVHLYWIAFL